MKKTSKIIFSLIIVAIIFSVAIIPQVRANALLDGLNDVVLDTDLKTGTTNLPMAIGRIIQIFLGFLGIIAVVLIIFAGYTWLTAGGDTGKVDKARAYIKNAVIGIVIILSSYIITSYVINQVSKTLK